jgi:hypothetical protein
VSNEIKDTRGSLTHCVVVITNVPEKNDARLEKGDRAVVVIDDQREDGLVIVELLKPPKYRVWLSRQNFELAPVEPA